MKYLSLILPTLALSACATTVKNYNYVDKTITSSDAQVISTDLVFYLKDALPPASSPLQIQSASDAFTVRLVNELQQNGYAIITGIDGASDNGSAAIPFLYKVTPIENGVVLIVQYQDQQITRFYMRTSAGLAAASSFSVRTN